MTDEQHQFEAWATMSRMNLGKTADGDYVNVAVSSCWSAWQAAMSNRNYVQMLATAPRRPGT